MTTNDRLSDEQLDDLAERISDPDSNPRFRQFRRELTALVAEVRGYRAAQPAADAREAAGALYARVMAAPQEEREQAVNWLAEVIDQQRAAAVAEAVKVLRGELQNIVNAKRFDHTRFADDTEFADWAQSRARAALAAAIKEVSGD